MVLRSQPLPSNSLPFVSPNRMCRAWEILRKRVRQAWVVKLHCAEKRESYLEIVSPWPEIFSLQLTKGKLATGFLVEQIVVKGKLRSKG